MDYDLFVIGAGSGGVRAARMASQLGARTAIAEERFLGGTCVNVGCIPKKLYYYGSHHAHAIAEARGYGWSGEMSFDWLQLRDNKNIEIQRLNDIYQQLLQQAGVQIYEQRAELLEPHRIQLSDGSNITAERVLLATGGKAHVPAFPGSEHAITSDDVFELAQLPSRLLVVGGGYIAVEFACIFAALGCAVELSYRGDRILRHFDGDVSQSVQAEMQRCEVDIHLNSEVSKITQVNGGYQAQFADGTNSEYDLILYATGRVPQLQAVRAQAGKLELTGQGKVVVDDDFATSIQGLYALGDIIEGHELTPVAIAEAMVFVRRIYKKETSVIDYDNIPTAVFTQPSVGTVGLTEEQARAQYPSGTIDIYRTQFRHLKHTLSGSDERTLMKLVVERDSDKVLGVHVVGAEAGEIVQGFAAALKAGITKSVLDQTVGIHPTAAEELVTMREPVSPS